MENPFAFGNRSAPAETVRGRHCTASRSACRRRLADYTLIYEQAETAA